MVFVFMLNKKWTLQIIFMGAVLINTTTRYMEDVKNVIHLVKLALVSSTLTVYHVTEGNI